MYRVYLVCDDRFIGFPFTLISLIYVPNSLSGDGFCLRDGLLVLSSSFKLSALSIYCSIWEGCKVYLPQYCKHPNLYLINNKHRDEIQHG